MNNTRNNTTILVFDKIGNAEAASIPFDFDGDVVANEVYCDNLKFKGSLWVNTNCNIKGTLQVEAIYARRRICCYETIKVQDIYCKGPVVAGLNIIASGNIDCLGLDAGSLDALGNVDCKGFMRIDRLIRINGQLSN